MQREQRSLWEQLDSEVEPWRRGRSLLIAIAAFQFLAQLWGLTVTTLSGAVVVGAISILGCITFWLFFYLIWIGFKWVRWLWGAWHLVVGFCLFIRGWTGASGISLASGVITFGIGVLLCFSSAIYFFAQRQRETARWLQAVLMAALCLSLIGMIAVAFVFLIYLRESWRQSANEFAREANVRIYRDRDYDWVRAHVSEKTFGPYGDDRLHYFFGANRQGLGRVDTFESPSSTIVMQITWSLELHASVKVNCRASAPAGPLVTHEIISGSPADWRLEHMWWDWIPLPPAK